LGKTAYQFSEELRQWGPDRVSRDPVSLEEAEAYCRRLSQTHYENFPVVSWCLPRKFHRHFHNIYAYCRWADDLADEIGDSDQSLKLLNWWRENLADCYAEKIQHPVFIALQKTISECAIPREPFENLISAFEQDQHITNYETFEELEDYCQRSANPVGRLVLYACGEFSEEKAAWSDLICTGLQLTNFWQDVSADLDMGRIYLPKEDCETFEYCLEDLKNRATNPAFLAMMEFQVSRAREFLLAGLPLVKELPGRLRIDIELFARGGLRLLDIIQSMGYRVWNDRPVLKKRHMGGLLLGCLFRELGRKLRLR
jgi:squalene synthase HpnC